VDAVREGRITFQRILTYTLNSVTGKIAKVLGMAVGLVVTGHAILTPMLMVIVLITGDFLGMSLTTDNVQPSPKPNAWRIGNLTLAGVFMGVSELIFFLAVLAIGKYRLGLAIEGIQTLAFLAVVFGNQATTYANRTRQRLWSIRPSFFLVLSSAADLSIASILASLGIAMTPLPLRLVGATFAGAVLYALVADLVKVPIFRRLKIG
jgi:H+-transporting ATPase